MTERYVYLCEDSTEGIFSAVYRAYEDRHGHENNEIRLAGSGYNRELFTEYIPVETDYEKATKVAHTIQRKISGTAYDFILKASLSWKPGKADAVYRFIIEGLQIGNKVMNHLTAPFMQVLLEAERQTTNEIHSFVEFLRFEELENGVLFAKVNPKSVVFPYLAEHFADRFSGEDWIIADTVHETMMIHRKNQGCVYATMEEVDMDELSLKYSAEEKTMKELWKCFIDTIAIKERTNRNLQTSMLPIRYRKHMKEFEQEETA